MSPLMPNFLVIGAAKAGTTSLYHYLNQHPEVFMSEVKETNFFALEGEDVDFKGPGDMEHIGRFSVTSLEDYQCLFRNAMDFRAVGEASPMYLYDQKAPSNIASRIPDVKLIAILRNPVDRAFSQYLMFRRDGREPFKSFSRALDSEMFRKENGWEWAWFYKDVGFYSEQISRYLNVFKEEQMLFLTYDEFLTNPLKTIKKIYRFIEVDDTFVPNLKQRHNVSQFERYSGVGMILRSQGVGKRGLRRVLPRKWLEIGYENIAHWNTWKPKLKKKEKQNLISTFSDDILKLQGMLNLDLQVWLEA